MIDSIKVRIPAHIPENRDDELEYIRSLLPEEKQKVFDFFIKEGLFVYKRNEYKEV